MSSRLIELPTAVDDMQRLFLLLVLQAPVWVSSPAHTPCAVLMISH